MTEYYLTKDIITKIQLKEQLSLDICIFIPSHIKSSIQINNLLKKTIPSLINQKHMKCNIYLSISFKNNKLKKTFIKLYKKNQDKLENLTYNISSIQLFQVEHIQFLFNKFAHKYKYIMFCDDDDTYNEYRIAMFDIILSNSEKHRKPYAIADLVNIESGDDLEYWSFMYKYEILEQFFNLCKGYEDLFKSKYADLYLMVFMYYYSCNFDNDKELIIIPDNLYNYNRESKSSICNKKPLPIIFEKNKIKINDNYYITGITTSLIIKNDNIYDKLIDIKHGITKEYLELLVPEKEKIIELTNKLYLNNTNKKFLYIC